MWMADLLGGGGGGGKLGCLGGKEDFHKTAAFKSYGVYSAN